MTPVPLAVVSVLTGPALADPPLDPSADDARSALRRELARPEYQDDDLVGRFLRWLDRLLGGGVDGASTSTPVQALAVMVLVLVLVLGAALVVSRTRRTARADQRENDVLTGERLTASGLRDRAEAALAAGRHEEAVVDGFRALALRQVERGRLDDAPGVTAHEVARLLAAELGDRSGDVAGAADLFDAVLYGDRPATAEQARGVLDLDRELARGR